jgi:hypothetical protein
MRACENCGKLELRFAGFRIYETTHSPSGEVRLPSNFQV